MGNYPDWGVKLDNSELHACLKLFPRCEDVYGPPMCWDIVTSSLSLSHSWGRICSLVSGSVNNQPEKERIRTGKVR